MGYLDRYHYNFASFEDYHYYSPIQRFVTTICYVLCILWIPLDPFVDQRIFLSPKIHPQSFSPFMSLTCGPHTSSSNPSYSPTTIRGYTTVLTLSLSLSLTAHGAAPRRIRHSSNTYVVASTYAAPHPHNRQSVPVLAALGSAVAISMVQNTVSTSWCFGSPRRVVASRASSSTRSRSARATKGACRSSWGRRGWLMTRRPVRRGGD